MMSDILLNISQLNIFLLTSRYKLEAKLFESEYKIKESCEEKVSPQFREYSRTHEVLYKS